MTNKMAFGSLCAREAPVNTTTKPHLLPIYATSSFAFENIRQGIEIFEGKQSGHVYGRFGNPTVDAVAEKIAAMEVHGSNMEAHGILMSSGMSAISTLLLAVLKSGDKVLTQGNLYGGTMELLTRVMAPMGIQTIMVNLKDTEAVEQLLKEESSIRIIYFETPANPTMACVDMEAIAGLAQKYDCITVADNTFCTPYLQQPFKFGADFIVHSTTKFLNGHGNSIGGILIGKDLEFMRTRVWQTMKLAGTNSNPFDAWLIHNGLKTLELRMQRHCENAQIIAEYLEKHPKVDRVNYNGLPSHPDHEIAQKQMRAFGGILSFELKEGLKAGINFMSHIQFCTLAPTLGDVDTLILHPASMSHVNIPKELRLQNDITDGLVRLSVGIENVQDIIGDLDQALQQA